MNIIKSSKCESIPFISMMRKVGEGMFLLVCGVAMGGCGMLPQMPAVAPTEPIDASRPSISTLRAPPKIALALGGGAARGFAHIGVIKTLEAHGIAVEMVAGTSAGSVIGALYAAGHSGFELQKMALQMDDAVVKDWILPDRGVIKGEQLQGYINRAVQNRPIEKLKKTLGVVATDLQSGEQIVFRQGNTGMAVRASSSVPGIFQPVAISGHEYVDGGLTSPVPVNAAKALGADLVIAVDISAKPQHGKIKDTVDVLLQTFAIMGQSISELEVAKADVVIRPHTVTIGAADFDGKHLAILEGEKAAQQLLPLIKAKIREFMGVTDILPGKIDMPKKLAAIAPHAADAEALYQRGLRQEKDNNPAAALKSFLDAASAGHAQAMKELGDIYGMGNAAVRRDYATSIKWYSRAAELGVAVPKELLRR